MPTPDTPTNFDVLVVGSGASGGWAAKRLSEAGLNVAIVEAGKPQSDANFSEHKPAFELKYRNMADSIVAKNHPIQGKFDVCNEYTQDWFVNDHDEPYTTPADKPYNWMGRLRITGGRTNVWGRVSLRFSDQDFKSASQDGYGEDWPDGQFQPPMPLTCQESIFRERVKAKFGRTVTLARSANLTRPINGRGPCHFCGPCERGCVTHSYFNSSFTTVPDALKTGKCKLISNAMVHKIIMDPTTNRARGLLYVDRVTKKSHELTARAVVLCAQSQESTRILLNSGTREHPNGLANSSGALGHYLTAHVRSGGGKGEFPEFSHKKTASGPNKPVGIYVARFRNLKNDPPYKKFLRGYGYEGESASNFNFRAPGFGNAFKQSVQQSRESFEITGFGEVLPRFDNFVEIDAEKKDIFGIPVLKIQMSDGEK